MAQPNVLQALLSELRQSRELFARSGSLPAKSCHSARKHIKRARSYLRLYKPHLEESVYKRINRTLRNAGRNLSKARDLTVRKQTAKNFKKPLRTNFIEKEKLFSLPLQPRKIHAVRIGEIIKEVHDWPLPKQEKAFFNEGLKATLKKGKKAFKKALKTKRSEDFHEWRKQEKHLLYQQGLLKEEKEPELQKLKKLSDILGEYHDLAVFEAYWSPKVPKKIRKALKKEVAKRQVNLRRQGKRLGATLYRR